MKRYNKMRLIVIGYVSLFLILELLMLYPLQFVKIQLWNYVYVVITVILFYYFRGLADIFIDKLFKEELAYYIRTMNHEGMIYFLPYLKFQSILSINIKSRHRDIFLIYALTYYIYGKHNSHAYRILMNYRKKHKIHSDDAHFLYQIEMLHSFQQLKGVNFTSIYEDFKKNVRRRNIRRMNKYSQIRREHLLKEFILLDDAIYNQNKESLMNVMESFYEEEKYILESIIYSALLININKHYHFHIDTNMLKHRYIKYETKNYWLDVINNG